MNGSNNYAEPKFGIGCLGKVNTVYKDDKELMLKFYNFVSRLVTLVFIAFLCSQQIVTLLLINVAGGQYQLSLQWTLMDCSVDWTQGRDGLWRSWARTRSFSAKNATVPKGPGAGRTKSSVIKLQFHRFWSSQLNDCCTCRSNFECCNSSEVFRLSSKEASFRGYRLQIFCHDNFHAALVYMIRPWPDFQPPFADAISNAESAAWCWKCCDDPATNTRVLPASTSNHIKHSEAIGYGGLLFSVFLLLRIIHRLHVWKNLWVILDAPCERLDAWRWHKVVIPTVHSRSCISSYCQWDWRPCQHAGGLHFSWFRKTREHQWMISTTHWCRISPGLQHHCLRAATQSQASEGQENVFTRLASWSSI